MKVKGPAYGELERQRSAAIASSMRKDLQIDNLRDLLREAEWAARDEFQDPYCFKCEGSRLHGHRPGCPVAEALK